MASCSKSILAISSLLIPKDLAIESCWIRFILPKLADVMSCLFNSLPSPIKSLFNAAALALSRLRFLPVNNSASSSLDIDDSKSNIELAILSNASKFVPNALERATASVNACVPPFNDIFIAADVLATSLSISLLLKLTPN